MFFNRTRSKFKLVFLSLAVFISISFFYLNMCLNEEPDLSTFVDLFAHRTNFPRALPINYTLNDLKRFIIESNSSPEIRNKHFLSEGFYDSNMNSTNGTLVILVQVHSRINYLKELIGSLRNTKHIERALVIFSHDLFKSEINELIQTIDFCAVKTLKLFLFLIVYLQSFI